jgi:hypothetical protein
LVDGRNRPISISPKASILLKCGVVKKGSGDRSENRFGGIIGVPLIVLKVVLRSIQSDDDMRKNGLIRGHLQRCCGPLDKLGEHPLDYPRRLSVIDIRCIAVSGTPYREFFKTNTMTSENVYSSRG